MIMIYPTRKAGNYCRRCKLKLSTKEKGKSIDAGFTVDTGFLCTTCAYEMAFKSPQLKA